MVSTAISAKPLSTTLLERIGNTPLVQLDCLTAHLPGVRIFGKAEWMNPGGSVKDRAAAAAVAAALEVAEGEVAAGREAVIVTILCDAADKYLSERYWVEPAAADLALEAKLGRRNP